MNENVINTYDNSETKLCQFLWVMKSELVITENDMDQLKNKQLQKSVNLQYNKLVCWADGTNNSSTKHYRFQEFFFHKSLHNSLEKPFFFYKITKMKI